VPGSARSETSRLAAGSGSGCGRSASTAAPRGRAPSCHVLEAAGALPSRASSRYRAPGRPDEAALAGLCNLRAPGRPARNRTPVLQAAAEMKARARSSFSTATSRLCAGNAARFLSRTAIPRRFEPNQRRVGDPPLRACREGSVERCSRSSRPGRRAAESGSRVNCGSTARCAQAPGPEGVETENSRGILPHGRRASSAREGEKVSRSGTGTSRRFRREHPCGARPRGRCCTSVRRAI